MKRWYLMALMAVTATATASMSSELAAQSSPQIDREAGDSASRSSDAETGARDLVGRDVFTANGEEVGEITDILIDGDRVTGIVLEVENRLGLSGRYISVPIDRLNTDGDDVTIDMTREQLQALPNFRYRDREPERE